MTVAAPSAPIAPTGRAAAERGALRILLALPGLHRVNRGAEVAFESIASELARRANCEVTLIGSGEPRQDRPYRFRHAGCTPRERFSGWPRVPMFRDAYAYEEATFAPRLWGSYRAEEFDVSVGCSFPFTNWVLRSRGGRRRPPHVYVTQNGDWPAQERRREYRWFSCDGLVCTNPEYYERNCGRWPSVLIPNGVDPAVFAPGSCDRAAFGLPDGVPVILMVSALIPSKRVLEGIAAAARVPGAVVVVAGDGPLRAQVNAEGSRLLPGRFRRVSVDRSQMPALYRAADVFLHMSIDEPSANAYMEALATGLPVVTHDRPVTRWTFERSATLVDTTDPEAVAAGLRAALAVSRASAVAEMRALVLRRFTWSAIAEQYEAFLRAVVRREARPGS
jgi:glycosyltransferase involved in cell wall biosynthesis